MIACVNIYRLLHAVVPYILPEQFCDGEPWSLVPGPVNAPHAVLFLSPGTLVLCKSMPLNEPLRLFVEDTLIDHRFYNVQLATDLPPRGLPALLSGPGTTKSNRIRDEVTLQFMLEMGFNLPRFYGGASLATLC